MAALTITASQVLPGGGAVAFTANAAVAITAGQVVYKKTDGTLDLADANGAAATQAVAGIAQNGAAVGQPVRVQTGGVITLGAGAAPVVGTIYVLSGTPAGIAPAADLVTGWRNIVLGVGGATNTLRMRLWDTEQTIP